MTEESEFRELPTPQPFAPGAADEELPSFLERLLLRWRLVAILVAVGLLVAVASVGLLLWRQGSTPAGPRLDTPPSLQDLAEQYPELAPLLNDPSLSSVYKDFLIAYQEGGIEAARALASKRGLLNDRDEIRITLVVDSAESVPALAAELEAVGITVEGSYKERVNISVPLALIQQLAEQQGIETLFGQLTQMQHIIRLELPSPHRSDIMPVSYVQGEGVAVTGADRWHAAGLSGQSVRVGVLDLGFDGYRGLLGSELPDSVVVTSFIYDTQADESGEVHGTACAEIVHDMAPQAELYFAPYDGTLVSMGQAVEWLLAQGVQIISNSTSGVVGPMDGSDEAADIVDDAVRRGVLWVNSSGNAGEEHYRGLFTDADDNGLHEFPGGAETMAIYAYAPDLTIALNWDDWQRVNEDYDLFLFDEQGDLLASSEDDQSGLPGEGAAELIIGNDIPEGLYYVAIKAHRISRAGTLDLYTLGALPEYPVAEHSLGSPADARGALTVGATERRSESLATYSSQGPSNDGRLKPELSAPAGVSSATYAPDVFDGTSASTPHVAGAAALVWSAFPDYNAGQVRDYLQTHALDLGPAGPDSGFGYGRLRLPQPPGESVELPPAPTAWPTPLSLPTTVPEATSVAALSKPGAEPIEGGVADGLSLLLLGALGLCGGVLAFGGGGLLLVALLRSPQRSRPAPAPGTGRAPQAPPPPPAHVPETIQGYGALIGAGPGPILLRPGSTQLGRSAENDIVLDDRLVSRRHARLECAGGRCTVQDLGSANGTFLNDRRVSHGVLSPGDRLRLGDVELHYQATGLVAAQTWLEQACPGQGATRHPLSPQGITIGRARDNDIHLADERASRHHARVERQQGALTISDLGSANGTFVNGQRVQRQVLKDGDEIRIGDSLLYVRQSRDNHP